MTTSALIVGAGPGISASFARLLARDGARVALAARDTAKLDTEEARRNGYLLHTCDVGDPASVDRLFEAVDRSLPRLDVVLFNASARAGGAFVEVDRAKARDALMISAYGGFLVAQAAARRMLPHGSGAILLTGASASVKGFPQSAAFAMGKFALRGLAQSLARELQPKGIHVAHFVIDGAVRSVERGRIEQPGATPDTFLDPDAIAETYLSVLRQPRSAWTWEVELRPWVERF